MQGIFKLNYLTKTIKFNNLNTKNAIGSTGAENFSNYSDIQDSRKKENSTKPNETSGSSGNDKCLRAFSTKLEEVAISPFQMRNGNLPPIGTKVIIWFDERMEAATKDGVGLGYLPTRFNYLLGCIENGFSIEEGIYSLKGIKHCYSNITNLN